MYTSKKKPLRTVIFRSEVSRRSSQKLTVALIFVDLSFNSLSSLCLGQLITMHNPKVLLLFFLHFKSFSGHSLCLL